MITKEAFIKATVGVIALAVLFGVILPMLISAKSTFAFLAGVAILVAIFVGGVYYYIERVKDESSN